MIGIVEVPCGRLAVALLLLSSVAIQGCAEVERARPPAVADGPQTPDDRAGVRAPAPPPVGEPLTIPEGTSMRARLEHGISKRSHETGDPFLATVVEEVLAEDGMVLVPEGARLVGAVRWTDNESGTERPAAVGSPTLVITRLLVGAEHLSVRAVAAVAEGGEAGTAGAGVIPSGALLVVELEESAPLAAR